MQLGWTLDGLVQKAVPTVENKDTGGVRYTANMAAGGSVSGESGVPLPLSPVPPISPKSPNVPQICFLLYYQKSQVPTNFPSINFVCMKEIKPCVCGLRMFVCVMQRNPFGPLGPYVTLTQGAIWKFAFQNQRVYVFQFQ